MKDFLFIYFSHLPGPEYFFRGIENSGFTCDFVTEKTIEQFVPQYEYKVVICYLHEQPYVSHVNRVLDHKHLATTFMVQHDDTDFANVMSYYTKSPDLVFQRELTINSHSPIKIIAVPMHFAFPSIYDASIQNKDIDVSFVGMQTNPRRKPFIDYINYLAKNDLSHLNWAIDNRNHRNHKEFVKIANRSKICLHFPGNSQDSIRVWELASVKTCLMMPPNNLLSLSEEHMPLRNFVQFRGDLQDLKDRILYYLGENRYQDVAQKLYDEYNAFHTPKHCFEVYYQHLINHAPVDKRVCCPLKTYDIYKRFWDDEETFWKDKR
jgi:hypothetical protein